jgi:hypothetical protein
MMKTVHFRLILTSTSVSDEENTMLGYVHVHLKHRLSYKIAINIKQ